MLKGGGEGAARTPHPPLVLAVTVLTSFTDQDVQEVGFSGKTTDNVLRLASLALTAGCGGVVSSVAEVKELRQKLGAEFAIVTPGIRPAGSADDDQARVATPSAAHGSGVNYIFGLKPL